MRIYTICRFRTQLADGLFWPQLERWQASRLGDTVFARPFTREQFLVMSLDQMRDSPALFQQRLLAHFGLPAPKPSAVAPARNIAAEQGRLGYAVRAIDCATKQPRRVLSAVEERASLPRLPQPRWRRCGTSARQRPLRARRIAFRVKWDSRKHTVPAARKLSPQQMRSFRGRTTRSWSGSATLTHT